MWHTITLPMPGTNPGFSVTFNDTAIEVIGVMAFLASVTIVTMTGALDKSTYKDIILVILGYFGTRIFGLGIPNGDVKK